MTQGATRATGSQPAVVDAALPQGLYRVSLSNGDEVIASLASVVRQTQVRVLPGDRVTVEISPFDPSRGKITSKP